MALWPSHRRQLHKDSELFGLVSCLFPAPPLRLLSLQNELERDKSKCKEERNSAQHRLNPNFSTSGKTFLILHQYLVEKGLLLHHPLLKTKRLCHYPSFPNFRDSVLYFQKLLSVSALSRVIFTFEGSRTFVTFKAFHNIWMDFEWFLNFFLPWTPKRQKNFYGPLLCL